MIHLHRLFANVGMVIGQKLYYLAGNIRASLLGVRLASRSRVSPFADVRGCHFIGSARIGRDVRIGQGSFINSGTIASGNIGNWCSIAYDVLIGLDEHDPDAWTTSPRLAASKGLDPASAMKSRAAPVIEDEVWVGAGVIILRGVTIGRNSVIAAGAVVTKDIPPYEIWGGVPARCIRKLVPSLPADQEAVPQEPLRNTRETSPAQNREQDQDD